MERKRIKPKRKTGSRPKPISVGAPFPYPGGKSHIASIVWEYFGRPDVYIEPFAGSLAVLLACPWPARREVVCDSDGLICNFWRSVVADPDKVAHYADWPTINQDLTARHAYLVEWRKAKSKRLSQDPEFYDAKMAGWWVWGISLWIGGGWCRGRSNSDKMPHMGTRIGGRGVSKQRNALIDHIPYVSDRGAGKGISKQRLNPTQPLQNWMRTLQHRLERTIVLNRSWESALTNPMLAPYMGDINRCIFLDPPYKTSTGQSSQYTEHDGDETAEKAYEWAVKHGNDYNIAYCCGSLDFEVPEGWEHVESGFKSHHAKSGRQNKDWVMFSPACLDKRQSFELPGFSGQEFN